MTPDEAATVMGGTTGRSQAAVMESLVCWCTVCIVNGTIADVAILRTKANHHKPAATSTLPAIPYSCPNDAIPVTMVTKPIGIVPRKRECTG